MKPLVIAHRGDRANFPDNTVEAFSSAFEKGAGGIELDVQYFRGELIVVHNYLFDQDKKYVSLEQVLERFADKGRLEIEVKPMKTDFLEPFSRLIGSYSSANIEITTSVLPMVPYIRAALPKARIGIIFQHSHFEDWMPREFISDKILALMTLLQAQIAHIPPAVIDTDLVNACHEAGLKVHVHVAKSDAAGALVEYEKLQGLGVDQCTSDNIDFIQELPKRDKSKF